MISRIGAHSYRCFAHLDLGLPRYAVLAGANGMGKSTLLDIPVLIGDILKGGLRRALIERPREGQGARAQTYREILHRGLGSECSLLLEAELPEGVRELLLGVAPSQTRANLPTHIRYELRLKLLSDIDLQVDAEYLDLFPVNTRSPDLSRVPDPLGAGWRPIIERQHGSPSQIQAEYRRGQLASDELSPDRLALSFISDQLLFPAATWFARLLKEGAVQYAPDCSKLRQARPPGPAEGIQDDAANLPWQLLRLQQGEPERVTEWVHVVRVALPNVLDVRAVEREEDHHAYLRLTYGHGDGSRPDHAVTSSGLSDGTLRILAFSILPYLEGLPELLAVEQPEDGIHPRGVDVVLESLSTLPNTQALVTTHSPIVLARTPIENLICLCRDEQGAAMAINGSHHPRLRQWQHEIDLGALFAAGVLS